MERLGGWLWRRHRRHFVVGLVLVMMATLGVGLTAAATTVGTLYLNLSVGRGLVWGAAIFGGILVGLLAAVVSLRGPLGLLRRWAAGDDRDPEIAWAALLRLPQQMGLRIVTVVFPVCLVTSYPVGLALARTSLIGAAALALAYVQVVLIGAILVSSAAQLLLRAPTTEVGAMVGMAGPGPGGWWTLRRRLVLATFSAAVAAGASSPLFVVGTAATDRDYLVAVLGAMGVAAYAVWLMDLGIFQPTVAPVHDLIAGTQRVRRGDLTTPVPVVSVDELGDLAAAFNEMQLGLRERETLNAAFGSYVDPVLASRLLASGTSIFEGEELTVSVLFADVRGFTSYSERVSPAQAVELLNRLFDVVVPALHEHSGHANHYLGDGLLAVFGAPQPVAGHADAAVAAAREIQRRVRAEFGGDLTIGIGINTGPVIAGTIGGGGRHEFTVIGDTVNVAARVEQLTKETGDAILITEATRAALTTPRPRMTKRGEFDVRGTASRIVVHGVSPKPRPIQRSTR